MLETDRWLLAVDKAWRWRPSDRLTSSDIPAGLEPL
jgi:hypothetical protein